MDLYKESEESMKHEDTVITVFNGEDKRKQLSINEDDVAFIGRRLSDRPANFSCSSLILSNCYKTVFSIRNPHLKVYNRNGCWYIKDENSLYGTYCYNKELKKDEAKKLPNNSLIKLSKGPRYALIY